MSCSCWENPRRRLCGRRCGSSGWRSKLVAGWCNGFPHKIGLFNRMRLEADAWIFNNQSTWEATGRLPRTFMIPDDWAARSPEVFGVFREVLDLERRPEPVRPDLSDAVTVFVTTVGALTYEACLRHLRDQDCTFRLQIIDHVAPMNVAFQRMLDECRTPYYVQVDEDMLLHPHAVRTLYENIVGAGANVAIYVAELYDVHVERCIQGVKIFRHDIVRRYPFTAGNAFESEQVTRLEEDGYVVLRTVCGVHPTDRTLGLHGTQWSSQSIYERYATHRAVTADASSALAMVRDVRH